MAKGSWTQSVFTGGEFSPAAAGRIDLPLYKAALAECRNMYPIEEGAVTRRPGSMFIQPTYRGFDGALVPFPLSQQFGYVLEFTSDGTDTWMRAYFDGHLITDGAYDLVTAISTANPCEITLGSTVTWSTGDQIMLLVGSRTGDFPAAQATMWSPLVNRQFTVTKIDTTHFTLTDMLTGANIDGSGFTGSLPTIYADRVTRNIATYVGTASVLKQLRQTSAETDLIITNANFGVAQAPCVVSPATFPTATADATFTIKPIVFQDGPYQDYDQVDAGTLSGGSGTVTFSVSSTTEINGGAGFQSTDVGRDIRFNEVIAFWNSGTTYSAGNTVSYPNNANAVQYIALPSSVTNINFEPDVNPSYWAIYPNGSLFGWGTISVVNSTTNVTVVMQGNLPGASSAFPLVQFAIGSFTNTGADWPNAATFFEGRLCFGTGINFDASVAQGWSAPNVNMAPTDGYGNVLDSSGFSYEFNGPGLNGIYWMQPDGATIVCGTAGSEWLVQASALGDPLTPTSFQSHQVTRLGSQFLLPVRPGIATLFVNRYSGRLIEYLADPFTSKYSGKPINLYAQHFGGLGQIEYQDAPNPLIWAIAADGGLLSCTYRRVSYFASEMPTMYGWAKHNFGTGHVVESIANSYISGGSLDALYMMTNDGTYRYVEYLAPPFTDTSTLPQAQFVDAGMTGQTFAGPPYRYEGIYAASDGIGHFYFNGLHYLDGQTVSVFFCGLDFGDHAVSATGTVGPIAFGSDTGGVGTLAYFIANAVASDTPGAILFSSAEPGNAGTIWIPGIVGVGYTSTVERLRTDPAVDARTQTGSGMGQLRRHHWYAIQPSAAVTGTIMVSGGDIFDVAYPAVFYDATGAPAGTNELFNGVHRDTVDSNDDLDGQLKLTVSRPVPFTLASWSGFLETEEL